MKTEQIADWGPFLTLILTIADGGGSSPASERSRLLAEGPTLAGVTPGCRAAVRVHARRVFTRHVTLGPFLALILTSGRGTECSERRSEARSSLPCAVLVGARFASRHATEPG